MLVFGYMARLLLSSASFFALYVDDLIDTVAMLYYNARVGGTTKVLMVILFPFWTEQDIVTKLSFICLHVFVLV